LLFKPNIRMAKMWSKWLWQWNDCWCQTE